MLPLVLDISPEEICIKAQNNIATKIKIVAGKKTADETIRFG